MSALSFVPAVAAVETNKSRNRKYIYLAITVGPPSYGIIVIVDGPWGVPRAFLGERSRGPIQLPD
jgi:hypothetical protein